MLNELYRQQIIEIVTEILEIDPAEMTDQSLFQEDHDADSLRRIEILATLEREFKIEIDQANLARIVNLQGVYDVVTECGGREE